MGVNIPGAQLHTRLTVNDASQCSFSYGQLKATTTTPRICNDSVHFQIERRKIGRRHSRSSDNAELGHFTLLWKNSDGKMQREKCG